MSEPAKASGFTSDFDSPSENARLFAYQNLLQKPHQIIHQELIEGFKNRVPMARESNPLILKVILNCVKKSVNNSPIGVDELEVLLYHDWKKSKSTLPDFIQNNKFTLSALELIKNQNILQVQANQSKRATLEGGSNHQSSLTQSSQSALKLFYSSLQNFIPRMSSPDPVVRLQAAHSAFEILKNVPIGAPNEAPSEPSAAISETISQFFNILKFRVQDSN